MMCAQYLIYLAKTRRYNAVNFLYISNHFEWDLKILVDLQKCALKKVPLYDRQPAAQIADYWKLKHLSLQWIQWIQWSRSGCNKVQDNLLRGQLRDGETGWNWLQEGGTMLFQLVIKDCSIPSTTQMPVQTIQNTWIFEPLEMLKILLHSSQRPLPKMDQLDFER